MAGNKTRTNRLTNTDTGRGLWPPAGGRRRCDVAKAMAFAMAARGQGGTHGTIFRTLSGREQETHCVSPDPARWCGKNPRSPHNAGQRLPRRGRSARRGRGGRWPGALAPGWREATLRRGKGDGLCHGSGGRMGQPSVPSLGGNKETHRVSPASAGRRGQDHRTPHNDRPAPVPACAGRGNGPGQTAQGARRRKSSCVPFRIPCGRHFFSCLQQRTSRSPPRQPVAQRRQT